MQNYKTTITGAVLALLKFLETYQSNGGNLADWKLWIIPAAIAALGYVAKDAGVTGTAKILVGCLCMMSLASCAGLTAFIASPLGQTTLVTAEALGKQLANAAEESVVAQIITKATGQVALLQAQGVNADTAKEIVRQSELAGLQAVIDAAQNQYIGMSGAKYVIPQPPAPVVAVKAS